MTLTVAWTRKLASTTELILASDSRLRWGQAWDCCPKIFTLPRSDAVLGFAHSTHYSYPIIEQVRIAIGSYKPARDRAMDLNAVRGHLLRVLNRMRAEIHDFSSSGEMDPITTLFLLCGYSWHEKRFKIWTIEHSDKAGEFVYQTAHEGRARTIAFVGDHVERARERLHEILRDRGCDPRGRLDMEPFEVLVELCRDENVPEIGGPPQLLKVYEYLNYLPYYVPWPNRKGNLTLLGRPLLNYEAAYGRGIDPDTLETFDLPDSSRVFRGGFRLRQERDEAE